jgi:ABC-type branched-subunit amino acid transport system ATPase component
VLTIADIQVSFGGFRALGGVSLEAAPGSIVGIVGPNGSGKSTLINVVSGIQFPGSGTVHLDGRRVPLGRPDLVAIQGIGRTFQVSRLARRLTVLQNMMVSARDNPGEHIGALFLRPAHIAAEERRIQARAVEILRRLELLHKANDYAGGLSGGQQKLLSLGMVLMSDPRVLLLDEPAAGVNPVLIEREVAFLRSLRAEGRIILLIEHNMEMIADLCDRVYVLDAGEVIAEGTPEAIRRDEQVMRSYLGQPAQDGAA